MDVHEAIQNRRSVRKYSPKPIDPEVMERMRLALRSAPSAGNIQPWYFVLVTDEDMRRKAAEAATNQHWMAEAAVIVVACGLPWQAYKKMGGYWNSVDVDVTIALDHLTLAAAADGLGTCWIGSFDEGEVKKLLGIPEPVKVVAMTPLGHPAPDFPKHRDHARRKDDSEIFGTDRYAGPQGE